MVKIIDSQALGDLNKSLGLTGKGAGETELLDGTVEQVIDIGATARRGGTLAGTQGIFRCVMRNIHAAAGDVFSSWQPYAAADPGIIAPFPSPLPDTFDFWLLGASIERISGSGVLNGAVLRLTNVQQGFGIDSAAAAVVSTAVFHIAFWDSLVGTIDPPFGLTEGGQPYVNINMRIPRKGAIASPFLSWGTDSDNTATYDLLLLCGVFPVGLGQDVAV